MSDLISRHDAIEMLKEYEVVESDNFTRTDPVSMIAVATIADCIEAIVELPSAESEQKRGEWIKEKEDDFFRHCSVCGYMAVSELTNKYYNFCPSCGAKMKGEENG